MREREEGPRVPKILAFSIVVLVSISFMMGCAIGLNQGAETKVEEFRLEIQQLNKQLAEYKKEVESLSQSFDAIARYIRKFWEELHPEQK